MYEKEKVTRTRESRQCRMRKKSRVELTVNRSSQKEQGEGVDRGVRIISSNYMGHEGNYDLY